MTDAGTTGREERLLQLADSRVSMTAWLILQRAFCECWGPEHGLCTCGWDER